MRKKWNKKKKGYLKIHFAVDTETKEITAMEVTDERTGDIKKFKDLVDKSSKNRKVKKVLADAVYDSRKNFSYLKEKGIEPGIKPRRVPTTPKGWKDLKNRKLRAKARGNMQRKKEVIAYTMDEEKWKKEKGYGHRWSVEGTFSTFKRIFGEHVRAKDFENMVKEVMLKAMVCNIFVNC